MPQVTTDDHTNAQQRMEAAQHGLHFLAESLRKLADKLETPVGVRLAQPVEMPGGVAAPAFAIIEEADLITWPQLERAVQAYADADDAYRAISAQLTPDQQAARNAKG